MTENKQSTSNNEIDLWEVLKIVGQAIGNGLKSCLRFLYRNCLWLFLLIILGGTTGFLIGHFSKKYYQSIILMQSKNVNCSLVIREIDALNEHFLQPDYAPVIAKKLSISEDDAKLIKSVSGIYAVDANNDEYPDYADLSDHFKKTPADTSIRKMPDFFYLKMELYSKKMPENVPIAITNFIGNNEFCKRENAFHLAQKQAKLKELKYQLFLLDSLEKIDYFKDVNTSVKGEQLFMLGDRQRPLFHRDYMALYKDIQELELDLGLYSNQVITIMQDAPQPSIIPQNSTKDYMIFITLYVLGAGILVLIIKENWRALKQLFKEKPII